MKLKAYLVAAKKFWPLALILLLAGLAVWMASQYLTKRTAEVEEKLSDKAAKSRTTVVVPVRDLAVGEKLDISALATRSVPKDYVNSDALTPETVDGFVGKKLTRRVSKGTPVLESFLAVYEFKPFSTTLETGTRAITLPVDEINSVSGMLTAGDNIDLFVLTNISLGTAGGKSEMQLLPLLENVTVRATGTTTERELQARHQDGSVSGQRSRSSGSYHTVTIAVTPRDAQRVVLAQQTGRIIALLRRPDDPALYNERLSASEVFGLNTDNPQENINTVAYIVGGSFATGGQGIHALTGQMPGGSDAVRKLVEAMAAGGGVQ